MTAPVSCLLLAAVLAGAAPPVPLAPASLHPDSLSSSRVEVRGAEAYLSLRCQILSLIEVIPGLDADGDELVTPDELAAKSDAITAYVGEHYQLWTGTDRDLSGGTRLTPQPGFVAPVDADIDDGLGYRMGAAQVDLGFRADEPIRDLMIACTLFLDTSPLHVDLAAVEWNGEDTWSTGFEMRHQRWRVDPAGRGVFSLFARLGWRHIIGGWDHLAFVLALVLSARRLRSLLGVVTAFTLAHSVTLALAALKLVDVSAYISLVEAVIALSIAWVAADNVVHPHLRRSRWIEAFVFGLVHGLGFAGFLRQSLVHEQAKGMSLFAFNVGVELGQVAVVIAAVAVLRALPRRTVEDDFFLAPPALRRWGSTAIAALGLFWFFERI